jgi:RNA-directed DNA polymerase
MNRDPTSAPVPGGDKQAEEDLWQRYGAERGVWTEAMLIALGRGKEGNKWFSLIDKVRSGKTLGMAWEAVRSNAGAAGVDRISVEFFGKDSQNRLLAVNERLTKNSYRPQAVRRVQIPKAGSRELRPLGIPTVTDRVVQAALKMVIEPIFESQFAESSYGFRPGRGCKDALREVERLLCSGLAHVVDVDIKGYFDNIPHAPLMALVKERIADGKVLDLIEGFLKQPVQEEGKEMETPDKGSPQGGVISPLLANLYLDPLDQLLAANGIRSVRYADDIVILTESGEAARQALALVQGWMEGAQLTLHPDKTRIVDMALSGSWFDFLGYRFQRSGKGKLLRLIRPKSQQKLRGNLKPWLRRTSGKSLPAIIAIINPVLRGWGNYFQQALRGEHERMDQWVRMRLRSILRKRHKGEGRGEGLDHFRWPNRYFGKLGLYSLVSARDQIVMSLRKEGAKC